MSIETNMVSKRVLKKFGYTLLFGAVLQATGCASLNYGNGEYGCKGMPDGVTCKSVQDVYELTDGEDYKERIDEVRMPIDGDEKGSTKDGATHSGKRVEYRMATGEINKAPAPKLVKDVVPLRTPAKVMRVFIRPWEDENGDLHVPGYVYTELEPRKWMLGNKAITNRAPFSIVQAKSGEEAGKDPAGATPPTGRNR